MPDPTVQGLQYAADYTVVTLTIVTSDGVGINIKDHAVEINLYEDIFSPCMTGSILMGDAQDLVSNFKLHGNEFLVLQIDKPSLGMSLNKVFRIYKISDREFKTASLQNYIIYFCSEELVLSTQQYISKAYTGMIISDMVKDLLTNKLGCDPKKINFWDKTEGIFNIIVPRMQPLEAIAWLSTRAYADSSTIYFFHEDRDGYNFQSYETMIGRDPYKKYTYGPKLDVEPSQTHNSLNYLRIVKDFDIIETNRYGGYNSSLAVYDFVNRKMTINTTDATQFDLLNDNIPVNQALNRFKNSLTNNPDSFIKFYPCTDSDPKTNSSHPENWLHKKAARLGQLNSFKMLASVPGDILLKAGAVIDLEMPQSVVKDDTSNQLNTLRSGSYLVSAVHHVFINDISTTVMELLSDSITGQLNQSKDSDPGIQKMRGK